MRGAALIGAAMLWGAPALAAPGDPYAALMAMNGTWRQVRPGGQAQTIANNCHRTGLFFVCEQSVGGKAAALVVFLPRPAEGRRLTFAVETLTAAGDRAGPWKQLVIDDNTWTTTELQRAHGRGRRERTVRTISGPDFTHIEIQASDNGETWTTVAAADATRLEAGTAPP